MGRPTPQAVPGNPQLPLTKVSGTCSPPSRSSRDDPSPHPDGFQSACLVLYKQNRDMPDPSRIDLRQSRRKSPSQSVRHCAPRESFYPQFLPYKCSYCSSRGISRLSLVFLCHITRVAKSYRVIFENFQIGFKEFITSVEF